MTKRHIAVVCLISFVAGAAIAVTVMQATAEHQPQAAESKAMPSGVAAQSSSERDLVREPTVASSVSRDTAKATLGGVGDVGLLAPVTTNVAPPASSADAVLMGLRSVGSAEAQAMINEWELSPLHLDAITQLLGESSDDPEVNKLQVAAMQRLDLSHRADARELILTTLKSPNDELVTMALDSIAVWRDARVADQLLSLEGHPQRAIRERAQQLHLDLKEMDTLQEIPRSMRSTPSSLDELMQRNDLESFSEQRRSRRTEG